MDTGPLLHSPGPKKSKRNKKQKFEDVDVPSIKQLKEGKKYKKEVTPVKLSKPDIKNKKDRVKQNNAVDERPVGAQVPNHDDWVMKPVSGVDLVSKEAVVTGDGKHVLINSTDKVLVYSTASGKMVRQLNTGKVLAVQKSDKEGEVVVATKRKICTWNFMEVKIVKKYPLRFDTIKKFQLKDILDIFVPEKFAETKEILICVKGDKKTPLYRMDVVNNNCVRIFENVKVGSVHIGENGNLVCAISDHKDHGYKDSTLLMYDRNLLKVMSVHTDKARPFTCAKVHPVSKVVACGDTSGRIQIFSGLEQQQPAKNVLHWHSLPVGGVCWSGEGGVLYSGGGEAVLVKWSQEEGSKPSFVPRVGGAVVGLGGGGGVTVLQLDSNRLVVVDRMSDTVMGLVGGLARNKNGWPAGLNRDREKLVMNGGVGLVQVYNTNTGQTHSLDITQQTHLTKERNVVPHNSEVERIAVSSCGQYLATVDCMWASITRTTLKLWTWSQAIGNYCLNTQVDCPHEPGVISLSFQPTTLPHPPMLLSVGGDSKAKLWQLGSSWSCVSCLSFRQLAAASGGWSSDGTVVGVAFGHIVTLWDTDSNLRTTLAVEDSMEPITSLVFGSNSTVRQLYTSSSSSVVVWDLLTLSPEWTLSLTPSPHTSLSTSPSSPLLALVQKDTITIVSPLTKSIIKTFQNTNCTGGATWVPNKVSGSSLFFLTYSGQLTKIGPPSKAVTLTPMQTQPNVFQTLLSKSGVASKETLSMTQYTRTKIMHDIEALLSLPLHTVPPPSQLRTTLVRNRLLALPKLRRGKVVENANEMKDEDKMKKLMKIEDVFKFEEKETEPLDLKSFCKLLKKSTL